MNEEDKPAFWEKALAFLLAVVAIGCALVLVKMGVVGLLGICK